MITKIDLYNAPYEINSVDRFYKDVDNKLANYKAGTVKEFSFTIESSTDMVITIEDETSTRGSYARIESSIFKDKPVSYWFLTEVTGIESDEDTRYKCKLDAIATHGEEVFDLLDGNKIKIDRLHEDRYIFDAVNNVFNLNKAHHGLINTDFKVGDTKGVELVYDGSGDEIDKDYNIMNIAKKYKTPDGEFKIELDTTAGQTVDIDNKITIENKNYFLYALVQMLGSPLIYEQNINIEESQAGFFSAEDDIRRSKDGLRNTLVVPVNSKSGLFLGLNEIATLQRLQESKIVNILKIPYQLKLKDGIQIVFDENGKRLIDDNQGQLIGEDKLVKDETDYVFYPRQKGSAQTYVYEIYAYKDIISFQDKDILSIPTSKLNADDIMDFIANKKTPAEIKRIIDGGQSERLEIALLNPEIMPIEMHFHDNKTILDFYNFANKADKTKIKGSYVFNEMGLETTLTISNNQFAGWSENTIMSFSTDQGATYLARHKYTNDAQKKSIDLQAQQASLQAHLQKLQGKDQAGNLVSGLFSLGASTAAGAHTADYAGRIEDLQPKIADAKKGQIQGEINDASATAPTMHVGSSHNLINLNTQETKYNFNWIMKKPNKFLRDKIVNFLDRHGYSFKDWILFKKEMVESRSKFDFIEMSEFKDFIGTFASFDINVLQLLDAEFKKGLRLWHEDKINYNEPNIEISIKKEIANI